MPGPGAPLVSVVIPTHNRAELVCEAIDSVLAQCGGAMNDPEALEVIVVDDASTDNTAEALDRYGTAIRVLRNESNRERGACRNLGVRASKGRWVAFLDADDTWEQEKLAVQLAAMGDASASLTRVWYIDASGGLLGQGFYERVDPAAVIDLFNSYGGPSALLIERDLCMSVAFPEQREVQGSEDWVFLARLVHTGVVPLQIDRPLARVRVHSGNSTANAEANLRTQRAALNLLLNEGIVTPLRYRASQAMFAQMAGRALMLQGSVGSALRSFGGAFIELPPREAAQLVQRDARAAWRTARRSLRERLVARELSSRIGGESCAV